MILRKCSNNFSSLCKAHIAEICCVASEKIWVLEGKRVGRFHLEMVRNNERSPQVIDTVFMSEIGYDIDCISLIQHLTCDT